MCGSTGLFIGCTALSSCPLNALLLGTGTATPADPRTGQHGREGSYHSPFRHWDRQASVRQRPRRKLATDHASEYFPPELVPVASLPEVRALPPEQFSQLMLRHLYRYLRFTIVLESQYVNPVALGLYEHGWGLPLPDAMRADALAIYTDEAYHALLSSDLMRQAEVRSGVSSRIGYQPAFTWRLAGLAPRAELRGLLPLLFAIVSETLITASLSEIPHHASVDAGVRDAVRDHALDEGRHYSYFASVLRWLWPALKPDQRIKLGLLVPDLIRTFLEPDTRAVLADLTEAGLSAAEAERLQHLVLTSEHTRSQYAAVAASSVRAFESVGTLDEPRVRDAFEAAGLLPTAPEVLSETDGGADDRRR